VIEQYDSLIKSLRLGLLSIRNIHKGRFLFGLLFMGILLFAITDVFSYVSYDRLNILRIFPSEEQQNKYDYVLDKGHFIIEGNTIYFCAQFQHRIFVLDIFGNLIKRIGRKGQGPAEFSFPLNIFCYQNDLYVTDNMNARIQIISREGECKKVIKLPDALGGLIVYNDKIILNKIAPQMTRDSKGGYPLIGIYDISGKVEKNIYTEFKSSYKEFAKDNTITMRLINGRIHCLQKYGTTYRIFNLNGRVEREFDLQFDPINRKEGRPSHYFFGFKTFCSDGKNIYAPVDFLGKICICVFDMHGKLIKRYESPQDDPNSVYDVMDMTIISEGTKNYLYLFLMSPEDKFYVIGMNP
jgi:hypothetical protein